MTHYAVRYVYGDETVDLAIAQGWPEQEIERHTNALGRQTVEAENELTETHPFNYLTEEQVKQHEVRFYKGV